MPLRLMLALPLWVVVLLIVPRPADASGIQLADFSAAATILDFDALSSGMTVSSQFADAGVAMYGIGLLVGGEDPSAVYSGAIALTITDTYRVFQGGAQVNGPFRLVATSEAAAPDSLTASAGTIGAQFIDAVTGNAATTNKVGAWLHINQWGPTSTSFGEVSAFGVDGSLLETVQLFGGESFGGYQFLGIGIDGIHRVEFRTGNSDPSGTLNAYNIDNLMFEPLLDTGSAPSFEPPASVPEGGNGLGLLSIGVVALACVRLFSRP